MTDPGFHQEAEGLAGRAIAWIAAGVVAITVALVGVAWLLVAPAPPPEHPASAPSVLEHGLFEAAAPSDAIRVAGERRLQRLEWIDRAAHVARIPIDRAIDAVVADPSLIAAPATAPTSPQSLGAAARALPGLTGGAAVVLPAEVER